VVVVAVVMMMMVVMMMTITIIITIMTTTTTSTSPAQQHRLLPLAPCHMLPQHKGVGGGHEVEGGAVRAQHLSVVMWCWCVRGLLHIVIVCAG